jgi:predicted kinase
VAIDNTNPDREVRKHWIDLAKKFDVPIRCALFTASMELGRHNDHVRALAGFTEVSARITSQCQNKSVRVKSNDSAGS